MPSRHFQFPQSTFHSATVKKPEPLAASACLQIVDLCLVGTLFVMPLFFGGRHDSGRLILVVLACTANFAWLVRQILLKRTTWTSSWSYAIVLAAVALVVIQLVSLPQNWLESIAPRNARLLTLWTAGADSGPQLGAWETVSLTPSATRIALAVLIAYGLLFVTAVQRLESLADIERLLKTIAIAATGMALFGLLQFFFSNGRFFWFYEHPYSTTNNAATGSFSCRNHFAHFLTLSIGPIFAWLVLLANSHRDKKRREQIAAGSLPATSVMTLHVMLLLVVIATLFTFSRGGAIALLVACSVALAIYSWGGLVSKNYLGGLVGFGGILVVGVLSIYGYDQVADRLDDLTSGSIEVLDNQEGRRLIWAANLDAIKDGGLLGSGAGSHREIYPIYLKKSYPLEYTHAENGYLQIVSENGYFGGLLLGCAIIMLGYWCFQALFYSSGMKETALAGGIAASLSASVVHSIVDFVWFIPACMSCTLLLAACMLRLAQLSGKVVKSTSVCHRQQSWWVGLTALSAFSAFWTISTLSGPASASVQWDNYLATSSERKEITTQKMRGYYQDESDTKRKQLLTNISIQHLRKVIARNPVAARAHLRLAGHYLHIFNEVQRDSENALTVDQIRGAAIASQFASAELLKQWLERAFGERSKLLYLAYQHTRRSLQLCPLQGEGYVYLAELCFLEGHGHDAIETYLEQAVNVRPYSSSVIFETGRQQLILGRAEDALNLWQKIYNDKGLHQLQIVQLLAGEIPAEYFLEVFNPDWSTLDSVWQRYSERGLQEDLESIVQYSKALTEREEQAYTHYNASKLWQSVASMQQSIEDNDGALVSLKMACDFGPNDFAAHRAFGHALLNHKDYQLAKIHLKWCLTRAPENGSIRNEFLLAAKGCALRSGTTNR